MTTLLHSRSLDDFAAHGVSAVLFDVDGTLYAQAPLRIEVQTCTEQVCLPPATLTSYVSH